MNVPSRFFLIVLAISWLFTGRVARASNSQAQDATHETTTTSESPLRIEPFTFTTFDGNAYPAELGKLTVPEDRKSRSGRTIQVAFIRLMHRGEKAGTPVVFLPPGPGIPGTILGRVPVYFNLLDRLRDQGDVIVIDIRGEGMSSPNLDECPGLTEVSPHLFESIATYMRQLSASAAHCAQFWRSKGVQPAAYNNREVVEDIEDMRKSLHYEHLRLLGFSAGTDLGMAFLRQHGDVVERAAFAATGAPEVRPGRPLVEDLELDKLNLWYKAARGADAPDLMELFDQDVKALDAENIVLSLTEGKEQKSAKVGSVLLKSIAVQMLNGTDGAMLPALLTSVHSGDYSLLQILAQKAFNGFHGSMTLIGLTVDCSAAMPADTIARAEVEAKVSRFGNLRNQHIQPSTCEAGLGKNATPKSADGPLFSLVPTLFISGTMDANTPPFEAETLRWGFPEGTHVVIKNGFHETLPAPEVQDLVVDFFLGWDVSERSITFDRTAFMSIEEARTAAQHSR
jgi:pimeloyl-ACP methyl ester carboxylesterase